MPRERRSKYGNDSIDNAGLASQLTQKVNYDISNFTINSKLKQFRKAVTKMNIDGGIVDVLFIGDSITEGQQTATATWDELQKYGYVGKIRNYFNSLYEDLGTGIIGSAHAQHQKRWKFTGATWGLFASSAYGIMGKIYTNATAGEYTELDFDGNGIEVYYLLAGSAGNFDYSIDGVKIGTVNANGTTALQKITVNNLTLGQHTLRITNQKSGANSLFLVGARPLKGKKGIRVNNVAYGGMRTSDVVGGENAKICTIDTWNPALTCIAFLANDFGGQVPIATYESNLTTIVQRAKQFGDVAMLTIGMYDGRVETIPQTDYLTSFKNIATAQGVHLIDVFATYDSNMANATALGFMQDTVHYNKYGHDDCARTIIKGITQ